MKISELQEQLERIKVEHGDIVVAQFDWRDPNMPCPTGSVQAVKVKKHYDVYVREDRLLTGGWGSKAMFTSPYQERVMKRPTLTAAYLLPSREAE